MDNQRVAILALVVSICLCTPLFFFFRFHSSRAHRGFETGKKQTRETSKAHKPPDAPKKVVRAYGTGPLPVANSGVSPAVIAEMTKTRDRLLASQEEMEKVGAEWLEKYLNDPGVSTITREMYRARNDQNIQSGYAMIFQGNYSAAKEEFLKAYQNPDATPAIRFTCLNFLISIALKDKNPEEYFRLEVEKGELLAKEDLSFLQQEKSDHHLNVMKEKQLYFQARNTPSLQKTAVESLLKELGENPTAKDREWAERTVKNRIAEIVKEFGG